MKINNRYRDGFTNFILADSARNILIKNIIDRTT